MLVNWPCILLPLISKIKRSNYADVQNFFSIALEYALAAAVFQGADPVSNGHGA